MLIQAMPYPAGAGAGALVTATPSTVTISPSDSATKTGGTNLTWGDASAYIDQPFTGDFRVNYTNPDVAQNFAVGLVANPTASNSYTDFDGTAHEGLLALNPLDKHVDIALSLGNLRATKSGDATHRTVRANAGVDAATASKVCFEVVSVTAPSADLVVGLARATLPVASYPGGDSGSWGFYQANGNKYHNAGTAAYGPAGVAGDVYTCCLDAGKIWVAKNGVYPNSGNPETGANSMYSGLTGTVFPALGLLASGAVADARFLSSAMTHRPATYTAWPTNAVVKDITAGAISGSAFRAGETNATEYGIGRVGDQLVRWRNNVEFGVRRTISTGALSFDWTGYTTGAQINGVNPNGDETTGLSDRAARYVYIEYLTSANGYIGGSTFSVKGNGTDYALQSNGGVMAKAGTYGVNAAYPIANLNDGNPATYTASSAPVNAAGNGWIVDLGQLRTFQSVGVQARPDIPAETVLTGNIYYKVNSGDAWTLYRALNEPTWAAGEYREWNPA